MEDRIISGWIDTQASEPNIFRLESFQEKVEWHTTLYFLRFFPLAAQTFWGKKKKKSFAYTHSHHISQTNLPLKRGKGIRADNLHNNHLCVCVCIYTTHKKKRIDSKKYVLTDFIWAVYTIPVLVFVYNFITFRLRLFFLLAFPQFLISRCDMPFAIIIMAFFFFI